jgi:hypothetical protein
VPLVQQSLARVLFHPVSVLVELFDIIKITTMAAAAEALSII